MTHNLIELKEKEAKILAEIKAIDTDIDTMESVEAVEEAKAAISLKTAKLDLIQSQLKAADQTPVELKVIGGKDKKEEDTVDAPAEDAPTGESQLAVKGVNFVIDSEVKSFFDRLQGKAQTTSNIGGGDATLPKTVVRGIVELLKDESDLFSKITVYRSLSNKFEQAIAKTGISATWTAEGASISAAAPDTEVFSLGAHGLKKIVEITNEVKDWATPEFMSFVIEEMTSAFAEAIDTAIIKGTGSGQPKGITAYTDITKTTSATKGYITHSEVLIITKALKLRAAKGASLVMHPKTWAEIVNLKDSDGAFIYDEARLLGVKESLALKGVPVILSEYMDELGDGGKVSVGYWNLKEYVMNVGRDFKLAEDASVGFKSDLHTFRGTMSVDGKVRRKAFFHNFVNKS